MRQEGESSFDLTSLQQCQCIRFWKHSPSHRDRNVVLDNQSSGPWVPGCVNKPRVAMAPLSAGNVSQSKSKHQTRASMRANAITVSSPQCLARSIVPSHLLRPYPFAQPWTQRHIKHSATTNSRNKPLYTMAKPSSTNYEDNVVIRAKRK